jgi:hypothetical protein
MTDRGAWVRAHRVCWEIEPLRELVEGRGVQQTGYEVRLFGRLDLRAEERADQARLRVHDGLRELALDVLASFPEPHALIQVRPFDRAVHRRPETSFVAEIELSVVAYPRHPAEPMPAAEAQERIAAVEEKLRGLGLHRCPVTTLVEFAYSHAARSR